MSSLEGKTAIVTGAGGGIGSAVVRRLSELGVQVAAADIDVDAATKTVGFAVHVDVSSVESVREMVATAERELGPVHLLVNNAGWDRIDSFVNSSEEDWDKILGINLKGNIACAHAVLPGMIERQAGRIVCVSSDAGRVGSSGEAVYSAAKGGIIAFSKALAREVARYNILVNCVAPGPTDTPFLSAFTAQGNDRILEAMIKATPLRRLAQPDEIAAAVAFFASDDAAFITGQTLSVNGGLTML